uniref:DNA topoisomerase 2 n=1 Tax=Chromera velia CCMP2878 TaxID=1169474 RepID=A0A0G4G7C4_9ALVE|eukprot:Cvel_20505.t1-p1 / transcript=Cvel_20505.t1 / gene=Cvel_20505 / organism=Chromera_velia_CCMP2878 / gene_product=DNA gyrase subunit B, putative / transcript_product=DNA gyrase subunit B, putative / location=Cvel_scaffold1845:30284-34701(-) / protein_length=848 / sequence_SO=supercontig / SO=protein_coding / is_pseudo=false
MRPSSRLEEREGFLEAHSTLLSASTLVREKETASAPPVEKLGDGDDSLDEYGADAITVLEGLEPVRKRPGMYIGSTGQRGVHQLVWEVVDNAVDEALAGFCSSVYVTLQNGGEVVVEDDGRGIPCAVHRKTGKSTLETVMTVLHAGGKFGKGEGEKEGTTGYRVSGGLHGVGVSVVNALSESLVAEVWRDGKYHRMEFCQGIPVGPLLTERASERGESGKRGTRITWRPDPSVFKSIAPLKTAQLVERLDELAFLNPELRLVLSDLRSEEDRGLSDLGLESANEGGEGGGGEEEEEESEGTVEESKEERPSEEEEESEKDSSTAAKSARVWEFVHEGGLSEFLSRLLEKKKPLSPSGSKEVLAFQGEKDGIEVLVALRWSSDVYRENVISFCNNIRTRDGGTHVEGVRQAVAKAVNAGLRKAAKDKERESKWKALPGEFIREGLTAVVAVRVPNAEFEGQTKNRLGSVQVRPVVDALVNEKLSEFFEWNPVELQAVNQRALQSQAAAQAAKAARELVRRKSSLLTSTVLPGKLADCTGNDKRGSEVFIVEGDSASGSAKQARDRRFQAVLPLRGKILNIEKAAREEKIYQNQELQNVIAALGLAVGLRKDETQTDVAFDDSSLRYERIIIMTDADVDGAHIRLLLLTFFYRYQKSVIENGRVFVACPPLFKVTHPPLSNPPVLSHAVQQGGDEKKKGSSGGGRGRRRETYCWSEEDLALLLKAVRQEREKGGGKAEGNSDGEGDDANSEGSAESGRSNVMLEGAGDSASENLPAGVSVQRYKGLGEMMAKQLWDTTMDPGKRVLKAVSVEDAQTADVLVRVLMGDCVAERKKFIANKAQDLRLSDLDY